MSELAKILKYVVVGTHERKLMKFESPRIRKLLETEAIEDTTLIQEEVYKTILEGAEPVKCMRTILPTFRIKSNSLRYVRSGSAGYADEVGEGTEIPIYNVSYDKTDFTIKKVGTRPLVSRELVDDQLFDVIALELRKAGARIENKLNRDALDALIGKTGIQSQNVSVSGQAYVSDISKSLTKVRAAEYTPTKLIMHPLFEGALIEDSNLVYANYAGGNETLKKGTIGRTLLGLQPHTLSVTDSNNSWNFAAGTAYFSAIVLDPQNAGAIAIRNDIKVEKYDDPIRDLVGLSVTMRYDVQAINGSSICTIKSIT